MKTISQKKIDEIIVKSMPHSDMCHTALSNLAQEFVAAHQAFVGGLSIEVGTRHGGSAYLMLNLLKEMYTVGEQPMLFTVDPYGDKPYNGGNITHPSPLYGDSEYVSAKRLLAEFPNHAHFLMTSEDFFDYIVQQEMAYWKRGKYHSIEHASFVLLDGQHDADTIWHEAMSSLSLITQGSIFIDNAGADPKTYDTLRRIAEARKKTLKYFTEGLQTDLHQAVIK